MNIHEQLFDHREKWNQRKKYLKVIAIVFGALSLTLVSAVVLQERVNRQLQKRKTIFFERFKKQTGDEIKENQQYNNTGQSYLFNKPNLIPLVIITNKNLNGKDDSLQVEAYTLVNAFKIEVLHIKDDIAFNIQYASRSTRTKYSVLSSNDGPMNFFY